MVDLGVLHLVLFSKIPIVAHQSDDKWESLSAVGTVSQQAVLTHVLLPCCVEVGEPQHPGFMNPAWWPSKKVNELPPLIYNPLMED